MFVREADEAYALGPASARPYIDLGRARAGAGRLRGRRCRGSGWGFVAEDPAFADLCQRLGVTFIGPSAEAMRKLGDKIGSKLLAEEVGVPVAPWSRGASTPWRPRWPRPTEIGYPLMLKATAGGGGRGIRKVDTAAELEDAYQRTRDEAERAFGSGVVFLERLVTGARHVEVQLIADGHGTAWAVGVRDCTVQRRNQKVIEESASPLLDSDQTDEVKASAERLAIAVGYVGAGTVEFLYHPGERTFAFLEVNTRLQVEHPITEVTTDLDLVKAQLHVAAGGRLAGAKPPEKGHAVEARLNAEDPDRDFAPSPGRIALLELPSGPGIRVDTGVGEGDTIPADFDSMIAKIIAYGRTREEALARLRRAMAETTVVIEGGATNKSFILDLLAQSEVIDGKAGWADTSWIDRVRDEGRLVDHEHSGVAVVAAGIEAYEDEAQVEIARLLESAHGGRPQVQHKVGRPVDFKLRGTAYQVTVLQIGPQRFRVGWPPASVEHVVVADVERLDEFHTRMTVGGAALPAGHGDPRARAHDRGQRRGPPGHPRRGRRAALAGAGARGRVAGRGRRPGRGRRSGAGAGEHEDGDGAAGAVRGAGPRAAGDDRQPGRDRRPAGPPRAGRGRRRRGAGGVPDAAGAGPRPAARPGRAPPPAASAQRAAGRTSPRSCCGYDVDPRDEGAVIADYLAARDELVAAGRRTWSWPTRSSCSACSPTSPSSAATGPAGEDLHTELRVHSSKEHFHAYLQSLDVERGGLPDAVPRPAREGARPLRRDRLRTAPRSWRRRCSGSSWPSSAPPPTCSWRPRCSSAGSPSRRRARSWPAAARDLLERLVRSTQLRFPVVGDLARSTRFRWFDQPLVDEERLSVLAGVRDEVAALAADPGAPDRDRADRGAGGDPRADRPVPRRAARGRHPRARADARGAGAPPLPRVRPARAHAPCQRAGRTFAVADYTLDDRPDPAGLDGRHHRRAGRRRTARLTAAIGAEVAARNAGDEAVVDLYLHWPDGARDARAGHRGARADRRSRCRSPTTYAGWRSRSARAQDRPVNYFTYRPTRRWRRRRGRPGPRRAPDGRPPTRPVAAARLRRHPHRGARGRAALRVRRQGEPGRPPAGRAGAGAPARRRTRRGRPGHRPAARRARGGELPRGDPASRARRAARPAASSTPTTCGCRSGRSSRPTSSS